MSLGVLVLHILFLSVHWCSSGLSSCQLQRQRALLSQDTDLVPQCMESGMYHPVQCGGALGQCWCVDLEGMEIYGTRQNGRPSQCEWIVNSVTVFKNKLQDAFSNYYALHLFVYFRLLIKCWEKKDHFNGFELYLMNTMYLLYPLHGLCISN